MNGEYDAMDDAEMTVHSMIASAIDNSANLHENGVHVGFGSVSYTDEDGRTFEFDLDISLSNGRET